ncbi:MAG TPA: hypothetical protein VFV37_06570 [Luteibaculaceae bacterium]|nr:hypothetical protein [Luteibaculaceae bacterium]
MRVKNSYLFLFCMLVTASLGGSSCKSHSHSHSPVPEDHPSHAELQLVAAEFQSWSAGVQQGGSGYEYYITIGHSAQDIPRFDSLVIDGSRTVATYRGKQTSSEISSTLVRATEKYMPQERVLPVPRKARLSYSLGGHRHYLNIDSFTERKAPNRP